MYRYITINQLKLSPVRGASDVIVAIVVAVGVSSPMRVYECSEYEMNEVLFVHYICTFFSNIIY